MTMLTTRKFETAKAGNRPGECEDACRIWFGKLPINVSDGGRHNGGTAGFAVCDGASESAFARSWAQILVDALARRPLDLDNLDGPSFADWLEPCAEVWSGAVPWHRIPWHGEAKARAGAMATLLVMELEWAPVAEAPERGETEREGDALAGTFPWRAAAVGDCCAFIVRDGALADSFPMDESGQFNITPPLICSNPANNGGLWPHVRRYRGECLPGDLIILASDALACWILQEHESGGRPWETLLSLNSEKEWSEWVRAMRSERAMRNDDTTMITVKLG